MPLLDASLALALTMLALASVSSLLVEVVHRVLRLRPAGLKKMLERLYERDLEPRIDQSLRDTLAKAEAVRQRFLDKMLANPLLPDSKWQGPLRKLEKLSTEEFLRRLGQTEPGKHLRQMGEGELKDVVDRLAREFEMLGSAASDFFTRRAKLLSVLAGIALAFIANINAVRIFDHFTRDPQAAAAVIAQSEEFQEDWRETEQRVTRALPELQQEEAVKQIQNGLQDVRASLQSLGNRALPIGYDRYPASQNTPWSWLAVLLTGFLLGLGGPFWFQVVSRILELRRALGSGGKPSTTSGTAPSAVAPEPPTTEQRVAMLNGTG
jgi:hypothetical protein